MLASDRRSALRGGIARGSAVTVLQGRALRPETGRDESGRTVPTCTRVTSAVLPCPVHGAAIERA